MILHSAAAMLHCSFYTIAKNLLKSVENYFLPVEKSDFQVYFMYKEYNNQNNKSEGDCIYALHRQIYGGVPVRGIDL